MNFLVAGVEHWNWELFEERHRHLRGQWHYVDDPGRLRERVDQTQPRYIFFIHWRWRVPSDITDSYECVCFHMTDLPYGRGGSPLQNLIQRGVRTTQLTALRMEHEMDAGSIYDKKPLTLEGSAMEIYQRMSRLAWTMIEDIVINEPEPMPQKGEPVYFQRRKPDQSEVPASLTLAQLHDFIRMLDAPGYPHAFISTRGYRLELTDSNLEEGQLIARVRITRSTIDD